MIESNEYASFILCDKPFIINLACDKPFIINLACD